MLLYIVRHGIPDYATDSLTAEGQAQAEALVGRLGHLPFTALYSSPLGRARATAAPTAERLGLPLGIEDWMSENLAWEAFHFTREDGKPDWVFRGAKHKTVGRADALTADPFSLGNYESDERARAHMARIRAGSDALLARHGFTRTGLGNGYAVSPCEIDRPRESEPRIAAFCHQGFSLHWLSHLLGIPVHLFTSAFDISHTGITVLHFPPAASGTAYPVCLMHSDLSHLFTAGEPLLYNHSLPL